MKMKPGEVISCGAWIFNALMEVPRKKILFAGVGNVLRKDDGVGVSIAKGIPHRHGISSLVVEMGIENYIGKINRLDPDILVIIDACEFNETPGFCRLVEPSDLQGLTSNTHNISLAKLSELFTMPLLILGIQPMSTDFGENFSPEVRVAALNIIKAINDLS
jgi:hydrogenase 3 maturation protease